MTPTKTAIILTDPRPVIPTQREIDENYFTATLDKIEGWLRDNQPSNEFRRVLLRASQTAFAGWGGDVNGD